MHNDSATGDTSFRRAFLFTTVATGVVLSGIFLAFPQIDLTISAALREACGGDERHSGWCHENGVLWLPRHASMAVFGLCCLAALIFGVMRYGPATALARHRARCAFLLAAFIIGPGLVANFILKDHWGRARPREVVEFGGKLNFTPPLVVSGACADNCSFVSGEASAAFTPFFAAALLVPALRLVLISGGILFGLTTGLVRVSTGGHFLSDVLFAGVFMALVTLALHALFFSKTSRTVLRELKSYWRLQPHIMRTFPGE